MDSSSPRGDGGEVGSKGVAIFNIATASLKRDVNPIIIVSYGTLEVCKNTMESQI